MDILQKPLRFLRGIGPKRAALLNRLGITEVSDLVRYYPRAWEDRRENPPAQKRDGQADSKDVLVVLRGRAVRAQVIPTRNRLGIFKAFLQVPSRLGAGRSPLAQSQRAIGELGPGTVEAVWFKRLSHRYDVFQKLKADFKPGSDLWIVGHAEPSLLPAKEIRAEEYYRIDDPKAAWHVGRIVPVYSATEGISQKLLREMVVQALPAAKELEDIIPHSLLQKRKLLASAQAVQGIHFPKSFPELEEARRRLAYEELLLLNLAWILKQRQTKAVDKHYGYVINKRLLTPFRGQLDFDLTQAQKRVINEIFADMQAKSPMTRLLQGDVGSGKTVVAIAALLLAVENGFQGAFMAPTEILAEQHLLTLSHFLRGLPVKITLLTSRVPPRMRAEALAALASGEANIIIGTHALLEEDVRFHDLRLVVIDEQHRFGVRQRATLRQKGRTIDLLVMTATPIPRTLALAMYGDLSVSTVDEMPPGRAPIATRHGSEAEAMAAVREQAAAGRQAYVVYPIISESSRLDLKAAKAEFERLKNGELKGLGVALIHGQMRGNLKVQTMEKFAAGEIQVLVATQVIEIGVDVPNAAVMVIQNADRFGLASLHQLRGRVGRGDHPSQCWLVADPQTEEAKRRIRILCESSDGFRIADEDLKLRGAGDVLGTLQHGDLSLKVADLLKDADLQAQARADAQELLDHDPSLTLAEHQALRRRFVNLYQRQWHAVDLA